MAEEKIGQQLSLTRSKSKKSKKVDLRKERYIVGAALGITAALSLFFRLLSLGPKIVSPLSWRKPSSPKTKPIKLAPVAKKTPEQLTLKIAPLLKAEKGEWAVWVEELEGDFVWSYQADKQLVAASLIKLPVVATLYRQAEQGKLDLRTQVRVKKEDLREWGSLTAGSQVSLEKLAFLSLNRSDNTAFVVLRRILKDQLIEQTLAELGMKNTSLAENLTTAADIALFFRQLYQGKLVGEEYRQKFLTGLTETAFETRIPPGVPQGIKVAHKVGTETGGVVADAGIVFVPQQPFLLVFLSQGTNPATAEALITRLTQEIYWFLVTGD